MDVLILAVMISTGAFLINAREQRKRIALLGSHLSNFQIEKLMETLANGYLRALGEPSEERRSQVWALLSSTEQQLSDQFRRLAADFGKENEEATRVNRLSVAVPFVERLWPSVTFDMRRALAVHAQGIAHVAQDMGHLPPKERAFMMTAELFLMQHTCHWFCKSKTIASARMLSRHQTPHAQLVGSVSAQTRTAYLTLIKGD